MSVLIKGMEMPKCCGDCPYRKKINPEENRCFLNGKIFDETLSILLERRHADCPLVEVPPHGRLIDADALKLSHCVECTLYPNGCLGEYCDWDSIYHIEHAPTIIETEEGK